MHSPATEEHREVAAANVSYSMTMTSAACPVCPFVSALNSVRPATWFPITMFRICFTEKALGSAPLWSHFFFSLSEQASMACCCRSLYAAICLATCTVYKCQESLLCISVHGRRLPFHPWPGVCHVCPSRSLDDTIIYAPPDSPWGCIEGNLLLHCYPDPVIFCDIRKLVHPAVRSCMPSPLETSSKGLCSNMKPHRQVHETMSGISTRTHAQGIPQETLRALAVWLV